MSVKPVDFFSTIPEEASFHVLSYLDGHDLAQSCRVSKTWRRLAGDDKLWKKVFPGVPTPDTDVKAFVDTHAVTSYDEVVNRCKAFASTLSLDQDADFRCVFPYNSTFRLTAKINYRSRRVDEKRHICIFMRKFPDGRLGESSESYRVFNSLFEFKGLLPLDPAAMRLEFKVSDILFDMRVRHYLSQASARRRNVVLLSGVVVSAAIIVGYFFNPLR